MAVREDLVASAAQFLQDPTVAASSVENKISFLQSKNLTQEEISVALARAGGAPAPTGAVAQYGRPGGSPQPYYPPYAQQAWQAPQPELRRDWRDWFIMATVVSGVGYGIYSLSKRYVLPLISPPTPEKLEQDKKSIEEQFDKAFALVEQLAKDTESLKDAEKERTEKLDTAISELQTVMSDLKSANRRREDDAQRIRDEVQTLKDAIPKAMDNQKQVTDNRLSELNKELTSLKTLVAQRMAPAQSSNAASTHDRQTGPASVPSATSIPLVLGPVVEGSNNIASTAVESSESPAPSNFTRPSGPVSASRAAIPLWQQKMARSTSSSSTDTPASSKEVGISQAS